ncbi:MAG: hypothetical protein ACTS6G_02245, partial [Candidatus Hodgkinia cicadicola]
MFRGQLPSFERFLREGGSFEVVWSGRQCSLAKRRTAGYFNHFGRLMTVLPFERLKQRLSD